MSRTGLRKCMTFKVDKQIKPIVEMKSFTKPSCNLCIYEQLTIIKNPRDKCVTLMNINSEIYGAFWLKTTFHQFCIRNDDTING